MQMRSNKKLLNVRLQEITGKHVTLRDMTNMNANMRKASPRNDLVELVERLNNMPGKYTSISYVSPSVLTIHIIIIVHENQTMLQISEILK